MTLARLSAADWPAVSALLDEALALPARERGAFVQSLDGERAQHRQTLQALLAPAGGIETDDFLGTLPKLSGASERGPLSDLAPGATIGPYRLLSELGAGGMGIVWLAERSDGALKRKVALKLPRLVWAKGLEERMARERDILASLEHPHVARLYDAGVDQHGRPYLALEYVEGQPIDVYARGHGLSVRQKIGLLLQVAAAVAFAHSRLVVHRDLKPGNILVTAEGQVRLLDFGIAKLMEGDRTRDTVLTQHAGRAMTLDYASPEQIRGAALGTASDLYSLGVVAFELLAGARPYRLKRGSAAELEEAIEAASPPLASSVASDPALKKALRGDLDAILNQALKKRPEERYASVADFAQDLQRHLQREPVRARPDSRGYRLRRFVQRHRGGVAATATVLVAVAGGTTAALWQAQRAQAQAERAEFALNNEEAVSSLYIDALTRLSSLAGSDAGSLSQPHAVTGVLESTLQNRAQRYASRPSEWGAMLASVAVQLNYANDFERALDVGRSYLQHVVTHGGTPEQVIGAHARLGRTLVQLGRLDEAEAVRRAGVGWAPEARDRRTTISRLQLMADLGALLTRRGKRPEAQAVLARGAALAEADTPEHLARAEILLRLSEYWVDFDDARALACAQQADALQMASGTAAREVRAPALQALGRAYSRLGRWQEAERAWAQSHALEVAVYGRANRNVATAFGAWANTLAEQGRYAQARDMLKGEIDALATIDSPAARVASALLQSRALGNALLQGDLPTLSRSLEAKLSADEVPTVARDSELIAVREAQALLLLGRAAPALARIAAAAQASPVRVQPTQNWFQLAQTLALAQLAQPGPGSAALARETAVSLLRLHHAHGSNSWIATRSAEIAALAAARAGAIDTAVQELSALEAVATPGAGVERAESALLRAEIWQLAARPDRAGEAARAALVDLQGQHPDSPRLAQARRLAAGAP